MKKLRKCVLGAGMILLLGGCVAHNANEPNMETTVDKSNAAASDKSFFPGRLQGSTENVNYDIQLDIPASISTGSYVEVLVEGTQYSDAMASRQLFGENKEILKEDVIETVGPKEYSWRFNDGSLVNAGGHSFLLASANDSFYTDVFSDESIDDVAGQSTDFAFCTQSESLDQLVSRVADIGYKSELLLYCTPLSSEQLSALEKHLTLDGDDDTAAYKDKWTTEDDAYIISGYQKFDGIPIYTEMMLLSQGMARLTPYNAPINAIYTSRGFEKLLITSQYDFKKTKNTYQLLPIEDVLKTVCTKLDNILTEDKFDIHSAKFLLTVRMNHEQSYECIPVWYFEAYQGNDNCMVILVDAQTGVEIPIRNSNT